VRKYQIVLLILGSLCLALAALAGLTAMVSEFVYDDHVAESFLITTFVAGFLGGVLFLFGQDAQPEIDYRGAVALTAGAWIGLPLLAAIPFTSESVGLSWTNAVFETYSGVTTTGSTVMTGLDVTAPSILLWRALLQWVGGIGIIGLSIAILPFLRVGGMQLFQMESSTQSKDRVVARPSHLAGLIAGIYAGLTALCFAGYALTGLSGFEAITHAMTTVSTGGYSTHDASMGGFSAGAQWVAILFMLAGALPFLAYVRFFSRSDGRRRGAYGEIVLLLALVAIFTLLLVIAQHNLHSQPFEQLRLALFTTVSIITTTGYAAGDYQLWGPFAMATVFILTFLGGCAGSTAGGFKTFRLQIALKAVRRALNQASLPHSLVPERHGGQPLSDADVASVALFGGLYVGTFAVGAILLAGMGLDFETSITASATAIANVGPGLGEVIGPAGHFLSLPDPAKWLLCTIMLMGRLEIVVILLLFTPRFWMR
jgi:trk system potassium uptake protein TrkH